MHRNRTNDRNEAKVGSLDDAAQHRELTHAELDAVSGGEFTITKSVDVASLNLSRK